MIERGTGNAEEDRKIVKQKFEELIAQHVDIPIDRLVADSIACSAVMTYAISIHSGMSLNDADLKSAECVLTMIQAYRDIVTEHLVSHMPQETIQ
jgi:hypothetical protein